MSSTSSVKIYAASFVAQRENQGLIISRVTSGIVLGSSEEEAYREGMGGAFAALPESEGWTDHQVILAEIPNELTLGSYRVMWRADKT
jgi:hypothetical protein